MESECIYKQYKNTLTSLLRKAEFFFYYELLCQSKSNTKKNWGTINAIIKRNNQSVAPQTVFNYDSKIYKNSKSIANGFNNFFVNVGPNQYLLHQLADFDD